MTMSNSRRGVIHIRSNSSRTLLLSWLVLLTWILILSPSFVASGKKAKILCLHGGGGNGEGFSKDPGMKDLEDALPGYEFVYADGAYQVKEGEGNKGWSDSFLWIPDPPGGKKEPTTDSDFSDASIEALDDLRVSDGPFVGILGYSQGAAYVPVYLSRVPDNTFEFSVTFCGYPTLTHLGLLGVVEERSPFAKIPSLVWIGQKDGVIPPYLTRQTSRFFESPTVLQSAEGSHGVPGSSDPTFLQVVSFILSAGGDGEDVGDAADSNIYSSDATDPLSLLFICAFLCFTTASLGWRA